MRVRSAALDRGQRAPGNAPVADDCGLCFGGARIQASDGEARKNLLVERQHGVAPRRWSGADVKAVVPTGQRERLRTDPQDAAASGREAGRPADRNQPLVLDHSVDLHNAVNPDLGRAPIDCEE
ncbi:MAG TPA: hypothetical protein VHW96_18785 [Solirubrobacteraceae bacterium]|nr:hypothetical protein [Solirubrobacteraceae bacterium]